LERFDELLAELELSEEEVKGELTRKLEKNNQELSLNRLQVYTSERGLDLFVEHLCKDLKEKIEAEEKQKASNEIFMELNSVNEELKIKSVKIEEKEK